MAFDEEYIPDPEERLHRVSRANELASAGELTSTGRQSVNKLKNQPKVTLARSTPRSSRCWCTFGTSWATRSPSTSWSTRDASRSGEKKEVGRRRSIMHSRVQYACSEGHSAHPDSMSVNRSSIPSSVWVRRRVAASIFIP